MKSFLTLTFLAACCNSAYCFAEEPYRISSATHPRELLTERVKTNDLYFTFRNDGLSRGGKQLQIWNFIPDASKNDYYFIQNDYGSYISCESLGGLCKTDVRDNFKSSFRPEKVGDNTYELVDGKTGYLLRVADEIRLKLAEYEESTDQEFILTKV